MKDLVKLNSCRKEAMSQIKDMLNIIDDHEAWFNQVMSIWKKHFTEEIILMEEDYDQMCFTQHAVQKKQSSPVGFVWNITFTFSAPGEMFCESLKNSSIMFGLLFDNGDLHTMCIFSIERDDNGNVQMVDIDKAISPLKPCRKIPIDIAERTKKALEEINASISEKDDVEKSEVSTDKEMTDSEFQNKIDRIYPLCVISDSYGGCYSGGNYTAWTTGIDYIPDGIFSDDVECAFTWNDLKAERNEHKIAFGVGNTPDEALRDLIYWGEKLTQGE